MTETQLVIYLSRAAIELVKAGKATFSSGGVRLLDGTLFEMYKPVLKKVASKAAREGVRVMMTTNPVEAVSAVADLGLGAANLCVSLKNGVKLNKIIQSMNLLKGLAWTGTALGAANLAMSAVSFAVISGQLREISQKIDDLANGLIDEMRAIHMEDKIMEIHELNSNLKGLVDHLEKAGLNEADVLQIESYLNKAVEMIGFLSNQFKTAQADKGNAIFSLLFDLTTLFASALKEYVTRFFYRYNAFPVNYDNWISAFNFIQKKDIKKVLKRTIWASDPISTTEVLEDTFNFSINVIQLQQYDLRETKNVLADVPEKIFCDLASYIQSQLEQGLIGETSDIDADESREAILLQKNGFAAA